MATSSTMAETHCHIRSISMPSRSHPNTLQVQDALNMLKSMNSPLKAEIVSMHLTRLVNLYNCVEDLLQLQYTQQVLVQYRHHKKWVDDLLDGSVRVLDVCRSARNFLLLLKEESKDLRNGLRKRTGESAKKDKVGAYISFRKTMKKDVTKCLGELKKMDTKCVSSPYTRQDEHLEMVINVLKEVNAATITFFQSLMSFLCSSPVPKSKRWSLVSKLKPKGQIACGGEHEDLSEVQYLDFALQSLHSSKDADVGTIEKAKEVLEALEANIEDLESGLECLFKHLIQARVSFLNIFAH